jgi:hypothetical protein
MAYIDSQSLLGIVILNEVKDLLLFLEQQVLRLRSLAALLRSASG